MQAPAEERAPRREIYEPGQTWLWFEPRRGAITGYVDVVAADAADTTSSTIVQARRALLTAVEKKHRGSGPSLVALGTAMALPAPGHSPLAPE